MQHFLANLALIFAIYAYYNSMDKQKGCMKIDAYVRSSEIKLFFASNTSTITRWKDLINLLIIFPLPPSLLIIFIFPICYGLLQLVEIGQFLLYNLYVRK